MAELDLLTTKLCSVIAVLGCITESREQEQNFPAKAVCETHHMEKTLLHTLGYKTQNYVRVLVERKKQVVVGREGEREYVCVYISNT